MGKIGMDASESDEDVEMTQAPPLPEGSGPDVKADTAKKAAKKRKHGDVEKGAAGQEEAVSTPTKKSKKPRVDSSGAPTIPSSAAKPVKQTPIPPPPIPAMISAKSAKAQASPAASQQTPAKSSKGKDKSKKKDSTSAGTKINDSTRPVKVTPVLPPQVPGMKKSA